MSLKLLASIYIILMLAISLITVLAQKQRLRRMKLWKVLLLFALSPLLALQEAIIIAYEVWSRRKTR